ncbi:MAG: ATP-binding protein [Anaerolineae bacterium]
MQIIQRPVTGEDFFDRENILERLNAQRNFALIGQRKVGKTSIILEYLHRNPDPQVLTPYIYILFEETPPSFFRKYLRAILLAILSAEASAEAVDPFTPIEELTASAVQTLPSLAPALMRLAQAASGKPDAEMAAQLLALPEQIAIASGRRFLICLDEFATLAGFDLPVLDLLRQRVMEDRHVRYLVAGSAVGIMQKVLADSAAPLFGHFDVIWVNAFAYEDARAFLRHIFDRAGLALPELFLNFLIEFTAGFPYYLAVLAESVAFFCRQARKRTVEASCVVSALQKEVFETDGRIYIHFVDALEKTLLQRNLGKHLEILKSAAPGGMRLTDIARQTGYSPQELNLPINFLLRARYLAKRNQRYYVPDPMLRFWLEYCYPLQEEVYLADFEVKIERFRSQAEAMIAAYRREVGKGHEARMRELFRAFDGRQKLHGRSLPRFRRVERREIAGEEFDLVAEVDGAYWVGEIKARPVRERDVETFLTKLTRLKGWNIEERLLICLAGIEEQSEREARDAGVWVWDLADVNTLLKACGQFRITV